MKKLIVLLWVPGFALAQSTNQNYTKATTYRGENGTLPQTTVTYFDGLGRPIQKVDNGMSSTGQNIVTHIEYDAYGRPVKEHLPFSSGVSTLDYLSSAVTNQNTYYTTPANGETTTAPYSEKLLEASPLDRVLKQAAPGDAWKMNSGHEIKFDYGTNDATGSNAVKLFKATATWNESLLAYTNTLNQNGNYAANELYLTVTKDENWVSGNNHTTQEFKDKAGKVVLKRTFNANEAHETYYVYDQFGNLAYVIPPLANAAFDSTTLNGLCYQYQYDNRNRLVSKKLPGKQWEFIVYDLLDRPVATGPALSPWGTGAQGVMVTQYDVFGRPTQTGWLPTTIDPNARSSQQTSLNGGSNPYTLATNDILSKNYYDNYSYSGAPTLPSQVEGQDVETAVKGMATGSWVRVLTTPTETMGELSYTLYDKKGRPVRTHTDNYLGGYTEVDSKLDFMGKTLYTITRHKRTGSDTEIVTTDTFTYTAQDRLALHTHQLDGGDVQLLADNTYDELGQLKSKKVGGSATSYTPLQNVDYQYNIRGWLKSINYTEGLISTDLGIKDDLFAFKISYNAPTDNTKALFNGNISETYWRTLYDDQQRKYTYTYDHLNRLLLADYSRPDNASIMNAYKESVSYDKNGNIMELNRTGSYEGEDYEIDTDKLVYAYDANNKNRLLKVTDTSGSLDGFAENMDPNGTSNDDYAYDANGNMTRDDNKAITNITYNHLNLPFTITFYNPHGKQTKIEYIYDATGSKKGKKVHYYEPDYSGGGGSGMKGSMANASATPTNSSVGPTTYLQKLTRTDYMAGGYQYKDEVIEFIPHAEGFIKNEKGSYVYYFNYTDHLGNVRVTYTDDGSGTPYVVEESNYYPFGLKHKGYNEPEQNMKDWGNILTMESSLNHKYKYNGKEFQDELGLNMYDYGARLYDPARAGWMNIDPLAEKMKRFSPYNYCFNNPLRFTDPDGMKPADWILPKNEAERKLALEALNELKNSSPKAKAYIERVENDKKNHVTIEINTDKRVGSKFFADNPKNASKEGKGSGGLLIWNPTQTNISPDKLVDGTSEVTPSRGLLEEVVHASRAVGGETAVGESKANLGEGWSTQWGNANEEIETNEIINQTLSEMGQEDKQRTTYTFNSTKTDKNGAILSFKKLTVPIPVNEKK